jgi:hypothetical protein
VVAEEFDGPVRRRNLGSGGGVGADAHGLSFRVTPLRLA